MWETLHKFGLQHCDLPTMIWNVAVMLRLLILNIDSRNKNSIPVIFYVVYIAIAVSYFYVYLISMVWSIAYRNLETGDLLAALIVFSLGISSEIGTLKLFFMVLHIKKVREIVDKCLECDSTVIPGTRFSNNLLATLRLVKKRTIFFWMVIIWNGILYIIKPMLLPGRHLMEDVLILYDIVNACVFIHLGKVYRTKCGKDIADESLEPMDETPNYQIAFVLMTAAVIWTCFLPANITSFLIVVTGYIEAHMLALSDELLHLWDDANEHYNKIKVNSVEDSQLRHHCLNKNKIINEFIEIQLKQIIKAHARNLDILNQIESVYKGAIATEFVILGVGLIAELLGGLEKTYLEMPFSLMQVGMDCFTGQRVIDASLTFETVVYDSKWENFSLSNMKLVLIMLKMSQKVMKLSAGGMSTLSFSCMMRVIKSIYSTYTALRSTMD